METTGKPLQINADAQQMLGAIRTAKKPGRLYGMDPANAEAEIRAIVMPMLEGSGIRQSDVLQYWWFLREACRLFRTRQAADLAFNLELVMRKWYTFGLEPNTLQFLTGEVYNRIKAGS
jgi:hypothetical protein